MAKWTRDSALQYLAGRGLLTKPADEYTTAYAKRLASSMQKQEQAGKETSRQAARGHARAKVEHIPRDPSRHLLDQYRVVKPPKRELDYQDLKNLYNKSPKNRENFFITIHGIVKYQGSTAERTLNQAFDREQFAAWLKDNPDGTVLDFANEVFNLEWEAVSSVGMSYPAKWS